MKIKMSFYRRYEMFNCLVEAAVQEGYSKCGCYPGYLVLSNETCHGASLNCFRQVFDYLGTKLYKKKFILFYCFVFILGKYREIDDEGERKTCMAACDDQSFTVTSSSNAFPGEEDFNHRETFCIIVRWVKLSCLLIDFPRIILQKIVTDHL